MHGARGAGSVEGEGGVGRFGVPGAFGLRWIEGERGVHEAMATNRENLNESRAHGGVSRTRKAASNRNN